MSVRLENVSVEFPVYSAHSRSLKRAVTNLDVGGVFGASSSGRTMVKALQDVSFSLADGERLGLFGHNGAGKTTLLRTLAGVYRPSAGSVSVEGEVSNLFDTHLGLDPEATGVENIFLLGFSRGMPAPEIKSAIPYITEFSGLGQFLELPVKTYSAGMAGRLAFAVATSFQPDVLLMDEWIATGDAEFLHKAEQKLAEKIEGARITVLATHSVELMKVFCNRVIRLEHGRVTHDGPISDLDSLAAEAQSVHPA